jgi:hypothetical protein
MVLVRYRSVPVVLAIAAMAVLLADCAGSGSRREEREARLNVVPENYKTDLLAALHTYVADPTNIRDAYISEPAIKPVVGGQNRYAACVRFNAKNSDGRYTGSRDIMAVFVAGRFEQFVDQTSLANQPNQSGSATIVKDTCGQADYQRFPELEKLAR